MLIMVDREDRRFAGEVSSDIAYIIGWEQRGPDMSIYWDSETGAETG